MTAPPMWGSRPCGGATLEQIKVSLLHDISALLNANGLDRTVDLASYPQVAASTLNYGAPALDGQHREGLNLYRLQEDIARALRRFESRLLPDSVRVTSHDDHGVRAGISIRIEADLRAEPMPLRMVMRTEIDPDTPVIRVIEQRGESFE